MLSAYLLVRTSMQKKYSICSKCPPPKLVHASERLLRTRPTFSETVINGVYYRDVLLTQKLLSVIRHYHGMSSCFSRTVLQH